MDRINSRIAQVYGYAVCLTCVVVLLASTHQVIDAAFDLTTPLGATGAFGSFGPMASFESYRVGARRQMMAMRGPNAGPIDLSDSTLSDANLSKMYDAERAAQIDTAKFRALRSLVSGIIFMILSVALFLGHWRWIRRTNSSPSTA